MVSKIANHMIKFMNTELLSELRMITKRTRKLAKMPKPQTATVIIVERGTGDGIVLLPSVVKIDTRPAKVVLLLILPAIFMHSLHIDSKLKVCNPCNISKKISMYLYHIGVGIKHVPLKGKPYTTLLHHQRSRH